MKKIASCNISMLRRRVRQICGTLITTSIALIIFITGVQACHLLFAIASAEALPFTMWQNASGQFGILFACLIAAFTARKLAATAKLPSNIPVGCLTILCGLASTLVNEALQNLLLLHISPLSFNFVFCVSALACAAVGSYLTPRPEITSILSKLECLVVLNTIFSAAVAANNLAPLLISIQPLVSAVLCFMGVCGNAVLLNLMFRRPPFRGICSFAYIAMVSGALMAMLIKCYPNILLHIGW